MPLSTWTSPHTPLPRTSQFITCVFFGRRFPTISTPNSWCLLSTCNSWCFFQWYHGILRQEIPSVREAFDIMPFSWRCWAPWPESSKVAWGRGPHTGSNPSKGPWGFLGWERSHIPSNHFWSRWFSDFPIWWDMWSFAGRASTLRFFGGERVVFPMTGPWDYVKCIYLQLTIKDQTFIVNRSFVTRISGVLGW